MVMSTAAPVPTRSGEAVSETVSGPLVAVLDTPVGDAAVVGGAAEVLGVVAGGNGAGATVVVGSGRAGRVGAGTAASVVEVVGVVGTGVDGVGTVDVLARRDGALEPHAATTKASATAATNAARVRPRRGVSVRSPWPRPGWTGARYRRR
jgi:hypothetical protein